MALVKITVKNLRKMIQEEVSSVDKKYNVDPAKTGLAAAIGQKGKTQPTKPIKKPAKKS